MIYNEIKKFVTYGLETNLIETSDKWYVTNRVLELLQLDSYEEPEEEYKDIELEDVLKNILDYAVEEGILTDNSVVYRDLFDTKLMSILVSKPSEIIKKFQDCYAVSPEKATEFYYKFSQDTDYIRRYRVKKDEKWTCSTEYGDIDITINLSKPEKDPKAIAAAKNAKQSSYPKCLLCPENEGYAGRVNHPARQNHRIMPITIGGREWGLQYSPYVYYNEHCIVFDKQHVPMQITQETFVKLFDFVKIFPHYFVGSNADLPIVGGSILTHNHFQGGHYTFAMAASPMERTFKVKGYEDVEVGIVKWPMSVIRIRHKDEKRLIELGGHILDSWRGYSDEEVMILANTNGEPHNTITPIARKVGDTFELDLVLRNNLTSEEHPLGIYHPHKELHHIKKENIGLIEVMGLAVLPARLKGEMELLEEYLVDGKDISSNEMIEKHAAWAEEVKKRNTITKENVHEVLKEEIGQVFKLVLEHAGVYKRDEKGQEHFAKFIEQL
ncbi:galactose-1-phosphate uridylyltransferase [Lachnospiraceae bacterium KM106-2]|nr:galactose-1-phosphate uridylyltransferase [Lachnospiraceae bacterium KM106-2]